MYNGIGLPTPRGSGTNGYVQRNLSALRVQRDRQDGGKEPALVGALPQRRPDAGILAHERKRRVEVKCAELRDMMEQQG